MEDVRDTVIVKESKVQCLHTFCLLQKLTFARVTSQSFRVCDHTVKGVSQLSIGTMGRSPGQVLNRDARQVCPTLAVDLVAKVIRGESYAFDCPIPTPNNTTLERQACCSIKSMSLLKVFNCM